MNLPYFTVALSICFASAVFAADKHDHGHEHKPLHGGVVTEVKDVDYELVAKPDVIQLHLRDHGKPVDVSKVGAKLTLLSGTEKQEVELKPAGALLEAKGNFKVANAKVVALVSQPGKAAITVRFALK
ncbi:MAG: hypothetical protein L6Q60_07080 [Rhodocyclaceae bacterium]|nr:hypothetical protein [Rhodocyclaceae bacterium]